MAARKQFAKAVETDAELQILLADKTSLIATDDQLREQRISFAFGNSPDSTLITKESVRAASMTIRLHAD